MHGAFFGRDKVSCPERVPIDIHSALGATPCHSLKSGGTTPHYTLQVLCTQLQPVEAMLRWLHFETICRL